MIADESAQLEELSVCQSSEAVIQRCYTRRFFGGFTVRMPADP